MIVTPNDQNYFPLQSHIRAKLQPMMTKNTVKFPVNSTSDNSKTCLTQTKFHGPCLGNDDFLGISRTLSQITFSVAGYVYIIV